MSVIVKGMKMPKCCRECMIIRVDLKCYCGKTVRQKEWKSETRPDWCPLVALPDKHGRLVDADALEPDADYYDGDYLAYSVAQVCNAPTIVDEEGET